jgi:hypothetical protein
MFKAEAVWKTDTKNEFNPAGFNIEVEVEPVSTNVMPDSISTMFGYMSEEKCDGFIIDLGTSKKHFIKS